MDSDELLGVVLGPGGEVDEVQGLATLLRPQVKVVPIGQEVRQIEKLGDKLPDVGLWTNQRLVFTWISQSEASVTMLFLLELSHASLML